MHERRLLACASRDARYVLTLSGHAEAEAALPHADRADAPDLAALDRALAAKRYDLFIAELPARGGEHLLLPDELVRFLRSTRTRLLLVTDLSPGELPLCAAPDLIYHRALHPRGAGRVGRAGRGRLLPAEPARESARARDAAACRTAARALERAGLPVRHLGLPSHPLHKIARRALAGYGARLHLPGAADEPAIRALLLDAGIPPGVRVTFTPRGAATALDFADPEHAA